MAFRKAIQLKPDFSGAYANLSSSLRRQNKFSEAEEAARKAIELPSDSLHEAYAELATALFFQGKLPEAVVAFRKTCELNPNDASSRYNAACAAALAGCGQGKVTPALDTMARQSVSANKPSHGCGLN